MRLRGSWHFPLAITVIVAFGVIIAVGQRYRSVSQQPATSQAVVATPTLPDLIAQDMERINDSASDTYGVQFKVMNIGTGPVVSNFVISIYVNGQRYDNVPAQSAGSALTLSPNQSASPGNPSFVVVTVPMDKEVIQDPASTISVVADSFDVETSLWEPSWAFPGILEDQGFSDNMVRESNEGNNSTTVVSSSFHPANLALAGSCSGPYSTGRFFHNNWCLDSRGASQVMCDAQEVSLLSDPRHCGVCGNRCSNTQECVVGRCVQEPQPNLRLVLEHSTTGGFSLQSAKLDRSGSLTPTGTSGTFEARINGASPATVRFEADHRPRIETFSATGISSQSELVDSVDVVLTVPYSASATSVDIYSTATRQKVHTVALVDLFTLPFDFSFTAPTPTPTVEAGSTANASVQITPLFPSAPTAAVTMEAFDVSSMPFDQVLTVSLTSTTVTPADGGSPVALTITAPASVRVGEHTIVVSGTSGSITRTIEFIVNVTAPRVFSFRWGGPVPAVVESITAGRGGYRDISVPLTIENRTTQRVTLEIRDEAPSGKTPITFSAISSDRISSGNVDFTFLAPEGSEGNHTVILTASSTELSDQIVRLPVRVTAMPILSSLAASSGIPRTIAIGARAQFMNVAITLPEPVTPDVTLSVSDQPPEGKAPLTITPTSVAVPRTGTYRFSVSAPTNSWGQHNVRFNLSAPTMFAFEESMSVEVPDPTDRVGPTVGPLTASATTEQSKPWSFTATIQDAESPITAAQWNFKTMPADQSTCPIDVFATPAQFEKYGLPLEPVDGKWDSVTETVRQSWTFPLVEKICHWVRGKDAMGNWGAPRGFLLSVVAPPPPPFSFTLSPAQLSRSALNAGDSEGIIVTINGTLTSGAGKAVTVTAVQSPPRPNAFLDVTLMESGSNIITPEHPSATFRITAPANAVGVHAITFTAKSPKVPDQRVVASITVNAPFSFTLSTPQLSRTSLPAGSTPATYAIVNGLLISGEGKEVIVTATVEPPAGRAALTIVPDANRSNVITNRYVSATFRITAPINSVGNHTITFTGRSAGAPDQRVTASLTVVAPPPPAQSTRRCTRGYIGSHGDAQLPNNKDPRFLCWDGTWYSWMTFFIGKNSYTMKRLTGWTFSEPQTQACKVIGNTFYTRPTTNLWGRVTDTAYQTECPKP